MHMHMATGQVQDTEQHINQSEEIQSGANLKIVECALGKL